MHSRGFSNEEAALRVALEAFRHVLVRAVHAGSQRLKGQLHDLEGALDISHALLELLGHGLELRIGALDDHKEVSLGLADNACEVNRDLAHLRVVLLVQVLHRLLDAVEREAEVIIPL